jgi:hypothetical protein
MSFQRGSAKKGPLIFRQSEKGPVTYLSGSLSVGFST